MPSLPKGCAFLGLGPICTGCSRGDLGQNGGKTGGRETRRRETRRHAGPVRLRARHPLLGGLHPRSPFAVHPVGTVPPLKRERRCGRLEPSWLPPCTWACDCLGRFSSPVTSSTLRCVGFAPPGERLAQTLPVDHRDRQPGSCRSLAGSCSYSRIADLRVLSRF